MKSLCIKTNNSKFLDYLLNELKYSNIDNICFSQNKFKHYNNIIIHYLSNSNYSYFFDKICNLLTFFVIDEFEDILIKRIINKQYFYFNSSEKNKIINICYDLLTDDYYEWFDIKFEKIYSSFYNFISQNKNLVLDGFINFRLQKYNDILDKLVSEAVNNYIIEKEYMEFISLLKLYINSQSPNSDTVHLIYKTSESILLDENKNLILNSNDFNNAKYLSDISFSSNDYTLNSLLTLLPKKIYIHLIDCYIDEFITTLKAIFEEKVTICTDCDICRLYSSSSKKNPNSF